MFFVATNNNISLRYTFAFDPLGHRVFKAKKRNVEVSNEEECKEIWQRRKISKNSYINPDIHKIDIVFGKLKETYLKSRKIKQPDICHEKKLNLEIK